MIGATFQVKYLLPVNFSNCLLRFQPVKGDLFNLMKCAVVFEGFDWNAWWYLVHILPGLKSCPSLLLIQFFNKEHLS